MKTKVLYKFQRDVFINTLFNLAKNDKKILLITNDQGAIALDKFKRELPKQFINAGISEQNIISVAAAMQKEGFNCFIYSIASFIISKSIEQIKIDLCTSSIPVKIFGVGAGYSYAIDGPTHHSTEDIGLINLFPNIEIYSPSDNNSIEMIVKKIVKSRKPVYVRMDREICDKVHKQKNINFNDGFKEIKRGSKICIISTGKMVSQALKVAIVSQKIGVIDIIRIKPLSKKILKVMSKYKKIVTLEEHSETGGIGSAILNLIFENDTNSYVKKFGLKQDKILGYGTRSFLQKKNSIDEKVFKKKVLKLL